MSRDLVFAIICEQWLVIIAVIGGGFQVVVAIIVRAVVLVQGLQVNETNNSGDLRTYCTFSLVPISGGIFTNLCHRWKNINVVVRTYSVDLKLHILYKYRFRVLNHVYFLFFQGLFTQKGFARDDLIVKIKLA